MSVGEFRSTARHRSCGHSASRVLVDGCSSTPASRCHVFALAINLRKGGTTHPFAALRNLAPGHYDIDSGQWVTLDGSPRYYESTDNLLDPSWQGRPPSEVIRAVSDAGFQFDPASKAGVVLHMLSCLAIDGRFGLTAVGRSAVEAGELYAATLAVISR